MIDVFQDEYIYDLAFHSVYMFLYSYCLMN